MLQPYIFLTLAIVLVWIPDIRNNSIVRYAWPGTLVIALSLALYGGQLDVVALIPMTLFGFACYFFNRVTGMLKLVSGIAIIVFSLALGTHVFPGFHNPAIVEHVQLSRDSLPYTLHFNFDKAVIGLFILYWLHPRIQNMRELVAMFKQMLPVAFVSLVVVMALSYILGYVRFDSKLPDFIGYWMWANLFFTCAAEEALFRGFLQRQLACLLSKLKYGAMFALVSCAILFGLAHAAGGATYIFLATVAGLGYGLVYSRTQRIEASILLHFMLNSIHILFFSYPALLV